MVTPGQEANKKVKSTDIGKNIEPMILHSFYLFHF